MFGELKKWAGVGVGERFKRRMLQRKPEMYEMNIVSGGLVRKKGKKK